MIRRVGAAAVCIALVAPARGALAQPSCPASSRPVVELVLEVAPPDQIIATTLEKHLRAELEAREIDVCLVSAEPRRPIARVRLHVDHPVGGSVIATIQIGDEVTDKRLERVLNLTKLPPETRALAVAAATDELLRASWAELNVVDAPKPAMEPPPAVLRAVASSTRAATSTPEVRSPRRIEIGVDATASVFPGHRTAFGGDLRGGYWFYPRVGAFAHAGASGGLSRSTTHGSARANAAEAGLGVALALVPRDAAVGARIEASGSFVRATFVATPNAGVAGGSVNDWTVVARTGLRGWVRTGAFHWNLGAAALIPLRRIRGTDSGETVTSIEGVGIEVTLGASLAL